jgi:uncharacterized membrane protein
MQAVGAVLAVVQPDDVGEFSITLRTRPIEAILIKYLVGYATTLVMMIVVDMVWLGVIAKQMYRDGIGHLMAEKPNWVAIGIFYPVFAVSLMVFAVIPNQAATRSSKTIIAAALFGFFAYATYDLTNLGTLRGWPWKLSLIDTMWGTALSATAALAGSAAMKYFDNQH